MNRQLWSALVASLCLGPSMSAQERVLSEQMSGFPCDEPGIEKGVSACYAGHIGNALVMAGGCNFPDALPSKGGTKRYYKGIYAATPDSSRSLHWKLVGWLPEEAAYGVSVTLPDGMLCIGGNNQVHSLASVLKISFDGHKATATALPPLPHGMDNFTGCMADSVVYVMGGTEVLALDLRRLDEGWRKLSSTTEVRVQPVSGISGGRFCVWGGFSPKTAESAASLSLDGFTLGPDSLQTLPAPMSPDGEEIFLGGAAAINVESGIILTVGGVNKDIFLPALNAPQPGYMEHEKEWYRFNPYISVWKDGRWHIVGRTQDTARAGASLVSYENQVYVIGGELKPGVRTPVVIRLSIQP